MNEESITLDKGALTEIEERLSSLSCTAGGIMWSGAV
jgi:hypothetical protein